MDSGPNMPPQSGGDNPGVEEDVEGHGGEGKRAERETPPIEDESKSGQTQTDAPADDTGVPSDEEMNRPD
jgi:hypothetical protein